MGFRELFKREHEAITAGLFLFLIEFLIFGCNLTRIGNYLDEWIYFGEMHFSSQKLFDLIAVGFADPRIIVRPLEALHYPVIYYFVHEKPLLYHVCNFVFELAAAFFVFLFVRKIVLDARLAFAAAALYILWPSHDATHYSIVASSVNVAAMFFICSLLVCTQAVQKDKRGLHFVGGLLLLISLLQYEFALPLAALYPCLWVYLSVNKTIKSFCFDMTPYALAGISFIVYRAKILPALNMGWNYQTTVDGSHFSSVLNAGVSQSFSIESWAFFSSLASGALQSGDLTNLFLICGLLITLGLAFTRLKSAPVSIKTLCFVSSIALLVVPLSYVIYGFSSVHMPQLQNGLNRINMGSSIGMAIGLPAVAALILTLMRQPATGKAFIAINSLLIVFFSLTCLQFAVPWVVSWQTQKQVHSLLRAHKAELLAANSLLLLDVTRFVRWAPVYDGMWDFQNTCRIILEKPDFKATVFTERLFANDHALEDRFESNVLTALPFQKMLVFQAATGQWTVINSRAEFESFIKRNQISVAGCK